jgi:hypothetical protein
MAEKSVEKLPQYMQGAYGSQPSPIAGAQLIFLNELTEMLGELMTAIQAISSNGNQREDIKPIMSELSINIQKSMTDLKGAVKDSKPKPVSFGPVTKAIDILVKQGGNIGIQQMMSLTKEMDRLIASNNEIIEQLRQMARPKIWEFNINRDSLDGHPVSVTAKSRIGE